ncbi:major facilitator superfamily domain-containing protein [Hirsutella rhossiliensis]|uniref:Major facilitator superfamily domain-containing protein n=1 Tax=Hirsutella rhossiliensis TaxID=111463 RepID=A0A9P8MZB7_9HYPO|nr:major facilitator superfamily domain-containing protein [Hirsutella rhossiliensis]KAH0964060.1 major facilitator superfamily domain-containing protein [Hirsutella rhossiliensis]
MANEHGLSLSYPNPSFSQMACLEPELDDRGCQGKDLARPPAQDGSPPISGVRQFVVMASLDTSIVSTSLVTISHELNDFVNAPWIVLAYLLTYMGFSVCISKLSDIYGRRNMLLLSWIIFMGFSLGCASARDMTALITCRAFQGIGASGLYTLTQLGLVEVGPGHRPSLVGAMIGATLAVAFVLGPLLGGIISQLSDWRWIFNLNIPCGLVTMLAITNFWPREEAVHLLSWRGFSRIDFIGSAALICSSGFLVYALQQGGSQSSAWNSPEIVSTFVLSGICWIVFVGWEVFLDKKRFGSVEPIFPIRLMCRRVYAAGLVNTLLTGFPYISLCIIIPERFQIVDGEKALMAGVHILPLLGACASGSFLGGALSSKRNNTSYTLVAASCLQLLGVGLMTTIAGTHTSTAAQYGFQAIFGLGVGLSFSAATIMTNMFAAEPSLRASAQGAVAQARVLGGCIGLSICTVLFNVHVNRQLGHDLTGEQLDMLHRSPLMGLQLPPRLQELVKAVYVGAFGQQIQVMGLACAAMVVVSLFTLERHPRPLQNTRAATRKDEASSFRRGSDSATEINTISSNQQTV